MHQLQQQLDILVKTADISSCCIRKQTAMHKDDTSENSTHLRLRETAVGDRDGAGSMEKKEDGTPLSCRGKHMIEMPKDFAPGDHHVICAKGKEAKEHPANKKLKVLVNANLKRYSDCPSKLERSFIVSKILAIIRQGQEVSLNDIDSIPSDSIPSSGAAAEAFLIGGFVRQVGGKWYEVGDRNAREKIGQAFRDSLHTQFRSSTKAKASIRKRQEGAPSTGHESGTMSHSNNTNSQTNSSMRPETRMSSPPSSKRKLPTKAKARTQPKRKKGKASSPGAFPVLEVSFDKSDSSGSPNECSPPLPVPHLHLQQPLPHPSRFTSSNQDAQNNHQSPRLYQRDLEPLPLSREVEDSHATNNRHYSRRDSLSTIDGDLSRRDSLASQLRISTQQQHRMSLLQDGVNPLNMIRRHSLTQYQQQQHAVMNPINMNDLYCHMSLSAQSASSLMNGMANSISVSTRSTRVSRPDPPAWEPSDATQNSSAEELMGSIDENRSSDNMMTNNSNTNIRSSIGNTNSNVFQNGILPTLQAYQPFPSPQAFFDNSINHVANMSNTLPMIGVAPRPNIYPSHFGGGVNNLNMRSIVHDNIVGRNNIRWAPATQQTATFQHQPDNSVSDGTLPAYRNDVVRSADVNLEGADPQKQWKQQFE